MEIYVYADWRELKERPVFMGTLEVLHTKGHQVVSFDNDKEWVKKELAQNLDPDLSLNISETDNSLNFDLAREVAKYFRISSASADDVIISTQKVIKKWTRIAGKLQISSKEQDFMASAFE